MVNWIRNLKKIRNEKNYKINLGCVHLSLSLLNIHTYALTHIYETNDAWNICMNMIWERRCERGEKGCLAWWKEEMGQGEGPTSPPRRKLYDLQKWGKKEKKNFFFIPVALIIPWEFHIPTTFFHMSRANLLHTCSSFKLNCMNTQACS